MDSGNRNPTIILKFKNPSMAAEGDYGDEEEEEDEGYVQFGCVKKMKMDTGTGGRVSWCQVDGCDADLAVAKRYHRRHKVCEVHAKAAVVLVAGLLQRFCQQCSRFHEVSEFDSERRSCRRRLAGHNERRRKSSTQMAWHSIA